MRQLMLIAQLMVLVYGSSHSNVNNPSQWNYGGPDTIHISYGNGYSNGDNGNSYFGRRFTDGSTVNQEQDENNKKKDTFLNTYGEQIGFGESNNFDYKRTHGGFEDLSGKSNRDFPSRHGPGFNQYNEIYKSNYPRFFERDSGYVGSYTDVKRLNGNQNGGGDGFFNTLRGKNNYKGPQYLNDVKATKSNDKFVPLTTRSNNRDFNAQYNNLYNGNNQHIGQDNAEQFKSISYNVGEIKDINTDSYSYTRNFGQGYDSLSGYNEQNKNRANSGRNSFSSVVGIGNMYYGDGYSNMNIGAGSFKNNLNTEALNGHYNYNNKNNNFDESFGKNKNNNRHFGNKQNDNRFNNGNADIFKSHNKVANIGQSSFNKGLNINGQFMSDLVTFKYGFMDGGNNIINNPSTANQENYLSNGNNVEYNNGGFQNEPNNNHYTSTSNFNNGRSASTFGDIYSQTPFRSNEHNNNEKITNFEYPPYATGVNDNDNGQSGVRIHKHFYVHVPPPDLLKEETTARPVEVPPPDTHYKIIFIKTPSQSASTPVIAPMTPEKNEKTLVYVLVKKPDESQTLIIPTPPPTPPSNPEVHFITYKTKEDYGASSNNVLRNEKHSDFSNHGSSFNGNIGLPEVQSKLLPPPVNGYHKK